MARTRGTVRLESAGSASSSERCFKFQIKTFLIRIIIRTRTAYWRADAWILPFWNEKLELSILQVRQRPMHPNARGVQRQERLHRRERREAMQSGCVLNGRTLANTFREDPSWRFLTMRSLIRNFWTPKTSRLNLILLFFVHLPTHSRLRGLRRQDPCTPLIKMRRLAGLCEESFRWNKL